MLHNLIIQKINYSFIIEVINVNKIKTVMRILLLFLESFVLKNEDNYLFCLLLI